MKKISNLMFIFAITMLVFSACKNEKAESTATDGQETTEQEVTTTETATDPSSLPGDTYAIDANSAKLNWFATKVGGKHNGTIGFKNGFVKLEEGKVTGGEFVLDMTSIEVHDLEGEWRTKLERHLKGLDEGKEDHFFNTAKFPSSTFKITKATDLEGSENANMMVYGDLTVKGTANPVGFTAMVTQEGDKVSVKVDELVLDRTKWGVNYNSKTIFTELKDEYIYDEFKLQFQFDAVKS